MEPHIGRLAFNLTILVMLLALILLPFLNRISAEFIVNIIALVADSIFLAFIVWDVKRQVKKVGSKKVIEGRS